MKLIKWTLLILLTLMLGFITTIYFISGIKLNKNYEVELDELDFQATLSTIAEGRRLFNARGCVDCHGANAGGMTFIDKFAVGTYAGSNLTKGKGGIGNAYQNKDWDRAIRHGVKPSGKPIIFMRSDEYSLLTDVEIVSLIAYLTTMPAVDNIPEESSPGPVFRALNVFGKMDMLFPAGVIDHSKKSVNRDEITKLEYGESLAMACTSCHRPDFGGGHFPGLETIPSNITFDDEFGIGMWSKQDFFRAMRTGIRPNNTGINTEMPWKNFKYMNDLELDALWLYLGSVSKVNEGRN